MAVKDLWAKLVDKKVVPCSAEEWATQFENMDSRTVNRTLFGSPVRTKRTIFGREQEFVECDMVSTVFLGLNSGFGSKSLWFETMSFIKGEWEDQYRYETYEEAVKGHNRVVRMIERRLNQKGRPATEVESELLTEVLTQIGKRKIQI